MRIHCRRFSSQDDAFVLAIWFAGRAGARNRAACARNERKRGFIPAAMCITAEMVA
jgi:hypothetical protein